MKQIFFTALSLILVLSISGCNNINDKSLPHNKPYSSKEAIKKGDVVYLNKVINFDRFEQLLINLTNNKKDSIRVTGYTDEGDPIFKDLQFDGKVIRYSYDNSNDNFWGSNKGLRTDTCSKVTKEENVQGELDYIISGCTNKDPEISYFLLRVEKR